MADVVEAALDFARQYPLPGIETPQQDETFLNRIRRGARHPEAIGVRIAQRLRHRGQPRADAVPASHGPS
jgi:hypothetical protein